MLRVFNGQANYTSKSPRNVYFRLPAFRLLCCDVLKSRAEELLLPIRVTLVEFLLHLGHLILVGKGLNFESLDCVFTLRKPST